MLMNEMRCGLTLNDSFYNVTSSQGVQKRVISIYLYVLISAWSLVGVCVLGVVVLGARFVIMYSSLPSVVSCGYTAGDKRFAHL